MENTQSPKDKINKIAKIEGSQKAQKIIAKAPQTSSSRTKKPATKATKAKKPRTLAKTKATTKAAITKLAKGVKKELSVRVNEKSLAKIESFFKDFAKKAEDKSAFIEEAILKHIKKASKKAKKLKK